MSSCELFWSRTAARRCWTRRRTIVYMRRLTGASLMRSWVERGERIESRIWAQGVSFSSPLCLLKRVHFCGGGNHKLRGCPTSFGNESIGVVVSDAIFISYVLGVSSSQKIAGHQKQQNCAQCSIYTDNTCESDENIITRLFFSFLFLNFSRPGYAWPVCV